MQTRDVRLMGSDQPATKATARMPAEIRLLASRRQVLALVAGVAVMPLLPRLARAAVLTAGTAETWAAGGTKSMTDKATYPDPFAEVPDSCLLVATTTEGPCTTESELLREDVSEGWTGLPVRLALRVVDESCNPLAGATVKIWHTNLEGSYSGQTPSNGMCLRDQSYASQTFFRGNQVTDADGKVFFDTCFPGWYQGRAVHIHVQVKDGSLSYRVSQVFFPEDVTEDVFANQSEYSGFGQPDTLFATDNIIAAIPAAERDRLILTVARMTDGAMLASKTIAVVDQAPETTPSATPIETTTAEPTASPSASATPSGNAGCAGDCNDGGSVGVDELVRGVNISLGNGELSSCGAFDVDGSDTVTVDELVKAVNAALNGCG